MADSVRTYSKPIIINNNKYGFLDNNNDNKYLFELTLYNNISKKYIKKLTKQKWCEIISNDDNINIMNIKKYKLTLTIISNNMYNKYYIEGDINHDSSSTFNRNNNLSIEFTQDYTGNVICSSVFLGLSNSLFISPSSF